MKKVMVFGTFDILHPGHINFFKQAKELGDYLIVVVAHDENVKKIKKHYPKFNQSQRIAQIKKIELVNLVIAGLKNDPYLLIKENKPDVICLGYDQKSFSENLEKTLKSMGLNNIKIIRLKPFHPEKYKSSILKKQQGCFKP